MLLAMFIVDAAVIDVSVEMIFWVTKKFCVT
jgi:hypothetical protein